MQIDHNLDGMRLLMELLADKWSLPVLGALCAGGGTRRFNALRNDLAPISPKSLTNCLQRLECNGLIERHVTMQRPLAVEYRVTALGHTLDEPVNSLLTWSARHGPAVQAARDAFAGSQAA